MKLFTKKLCLIILMMMVSVSMVVSGQQLMKTKPLVLKSLIKVDLVASAKYYMGVCPVTVKMKGTIKVLKAMTVKYYFLRSDGATSKETKLVFRSGGSKYINFTWKIGKNYVGWAQLIVKSPSIVKSSKIGFEVKCDKKVVILRENLQLKPQTIKPQLIKRSIQVIYPNGGEIFIYMRHHENNNIKWTTKNIGNVRIWLMQGTEKVHEIGMSALGDNGAWYCGYDGIEGRFYPGDNFKIRVESLDGKVFDMSDDLFTIKKAN